MNRRRAPNLSDEDLRAILEVSDGEENLMEVLEDSEYGECENFETVEDIRGYINDTEALPLSLPALASVTLQQPSTSSPDRILPPLFDDEPAAVLPLQNDLPRVEEASFEQPSTPLPDRTQTHSPITNNLRTPLLTNNSAWSSQIRPLEREIFTGYDQGKRQNMIFTDDTDLWSIFRSILDIDMILLMVTQTNIYAAQLQALPVLKPNSRIKRWKDVTAEEMLKFIGVYLFTGLVDYPTTEYYWKKDELYFHPLLHEISMSYDRFCLILRLLVTDNYYTSVHLARYLKEHGTDFCGTVRKNRRHLPPDVVNAVLKKGEIAAKQNSFLTVLKWKDQRDVLVMSTCHDHGMQMSTGFRPILKPNIVLEYNRGKKGIDIADQLASYNSPVRKTCFWYKKIAGDLMSICVINAILINNDLHPRNKLTVLRGHEIIIKLLLKFQVPVPSGSVSSPHTPRSRSSLNEPPSRLSHSLTKIPRRDPKKIQRKRCTGCYKMLVEEGQIPVEAA
ncbi:putative piggybac transposable element-derived, partial [Operophtera brumata]